MAWRTIGTKHNTKLVTGMCKGNHGSQWDKHDESPWGFNEISELMYLMAAMRLNWIAKELSSL